MADPRGFLKHGRRVPALLPVEERLSSYGEHYEPVGVAQVRTQASRCMDCGVPFCMSGCPLGNLIPEWNDAVWRDRFEDAAHALHATNNFPEVTGRVCPAPCENACVLGINAPPVAIKLAEQAIADRAIADGLVVPRPPATRTHKRVAIIGSGPAGLAAAQQLNRAGHHVTVYERADRAGGLLVYGIPHFKLEKSMIERRVRQIEAEGVRFELGREIGGEEIDEIRAKHDALILAIGAERPRDLEVPGRELPGVHFAMEYLPQSNRRCFGDADVAKLHPTGTKIDAKGKRVVVIGGGDTGSDCIGTALRQGARSVVNFELLPEPPAERPAGNPWPEWARIRRISSSVEELVETGGSVEYAISTTRIFGGSHLAGVDTVRLDWSEGRPRPIAGSEQRWDVDLVLLAMGFLGPTTPLLDALGLARTARGNVACDPLTRMSTVEGVFAAGDARRGQSLVVWAIAEGREVARQVDVYLTGQPSLLPAVRLEPFDY